MDRISSAFGKAKSENRALFVAYICAGDPDLETSFRICHELVKAGVEVLELGVPFSDPVADGLTNQLAAGRALQAGVTQEGVLNLVRRLREVTEVPITFYTYYNLVLASGVDSYVQRAKEAGVDALLTLDLPPEESEEVRAACDRHGMKTVFIVAPTTPEERLPIIAKAATGFLYYVSREGVTGVREDLATGIDRAVQGIRAHTDLPVVVGFGIGRPDQVRSVAAVADGVVVGSALVNCVPEHAGDPDGAVEAVGRMARHLVSGLR